MAGITLEELEYIAKLSSLELSEEDKKRFLSQMGGILDFVSQLQETDVQGIEPLSHPLETKSLEPREGVKDFEDKDSLIKYNVKHNIKDNGIVIKSPIKS